MHNIICGYLLDDYIHYTDMYFIRIVLIKQTLVWPSAAAGLTVFKLSAVNSCGGQATACFFVTGRTCT